jgi:pimeloyl-ACP methyl ester carboxylesterase
LLLVLLAFGACKKADEAVAGTPAAPTPAGPSLPYSYANAYLAAGSRFDSNAVYTTAQLDTINGIYGSNKTYQNVTQQLPFTFYAPKKTLDTITKRPFVMLIHGGGFLSGSYTSLQATARSFAVRGYAAATIEYRVGFNLGTIPCIMGDSIEVLKAVYRATQDANAAMRYFVTNATTFGIDTSQLFLCGSSAGNVTSTSMLYCTQTFYDSKITNLQATLGGLTNATNTLTAPFRIQAELTSTGYGLFDKSMITASNCKPTFYMQGSADATLPPTYGPAFQCPLGTYGHTYGSLTAKQIIRNFKYPYEHYLDVGADHDVSGEYDGVFIVKRMTSFIKRLWKADYRFVEYSTYNRTLNQVIQP